MDDEDATLSDYEEFVSEDDVDLVMSSGADEDDDDDDSAGFNASDADEAELDDDDLNFSQDLGKGGRKAYEVEFRVLDMAHVVQAQRKEIDQVASMFMIKVGRACRQRGERVGTQIRRARLLTMPCTHTHRTRMRQSFSATLVGTRSVSLNDIWTTRRRSISMLACTTIQQSPGFWS